MGRDEFSIAAEGTVSGLSVYLGSDRQIYSSSHPMSSFFLAGCKAQGVKPFLNKENYPLISDDFDDVPRLYSSFLQNFSEGSSSELKDFVLKKSKEEKHLELISSAEIEIDGFPNLLVLDNNFELYHVATDVRGPVPPMVDITNATNISFYQRLLPSVELYSVILDQFNGSDAQFDYLSNQLIPFIKQLSPDARMGHSIGPALRKKLTKNVDLLSGSEKVIAKEFSLDGIIVALSPGDLVPFIEVDEPTIRTRENVFFSSSNDLRNCILPLSESESHLKKASVMIGADHDYLINLYDSLVFEIKNNSHKYDGRLIPKNILNQIENSKIAHFLS